jgi:hypothetical protein
LAIGGAVDAMSATATLRCGSETVISGTNVLKIESNYLISKATVNAEAWTRDPPAAIMAGYLTTRPLHGFSRGGLT